MIWKYTMKSRLEKVLSKIGKMGKIGISLWGVKIWNFLKFHIFNIFAPSLWVLCQNLSENESKLLILLHIQFLRVLTRKSWFSTNMLYQNGHGFWTQPPTTMNFCQNVLYMYILKVKKFQECTCMRLYNVKLRYRGWSKFASPPGIGLKQSMKS